ncbi:MAG TPA: PIN domain nuclease [Acetobacteraceae bacterium]|nr:PIN domain nuclease [Acetobacteraceae bacterium]
MIAVDSSVWIAHFRNAMSRQVTLLRSLFGNEELMVGDIVLLEVLRGAHDERHAVRLAREMHSFDVVAMLGDGNAVQAARNYRSLRSRGITVRAVADLIIGAYCIDRGIPLLHDDRDFDAMQQHLGLRVL